MNRLAEVDPTVAALAMPCLIEADEISLSGQAAKLPQQLMTRHREPIAHLCASAKEKSHSQARAVGQSRRASRPCMTFARLMTYFSQAWPAGERRETYRSQFSWRRSLIRANSRSLAVTRAWPRVSACAAIKQIVGADRLSGLLETGAEPAVGGVGGGLERQDLEGAETASTCAQRRGDPFFAAP